MVSSILWVFIIPQSERSELGAFYFCPGVLSGYCCVWESSYCNWIWNTNIKWLLFNMGVIRNVPNSRAVVTLLEAVGYCWFWWCFITKVWSVDHIIIVIYINGVCYRGSSEMSQIWVQWWHFLTAVGYFWFWWCCITKVYSVHHIISVSSSTECAIGGIQKCPKFGCSSDTFWQLLVTVDFDDVALQKYIQFII